MFLPQEGAESNEVAFEPSLLQTGQPKYLQPWCFAALASTLWRYGEEEVVVGCSATCLCSFSHWAELMEGIQLFHSRICLGWLPWEAQAVAGFTCLALALILAVAGTEQRDRQSCCCSPDILCLPQGEALLQLVWPGRFPPLEITVPFSALQDSDNNKIKWQ